MLLRIRKRRTSSEVSLSEFCETEFADRESGGLDQALSVFRIDGQELVQCHTEYFAGARLDPKGRLDLDLEGLAPDAEPAPLQDWPFRRTAEAHCEIRCDSDLQVKDLASQVHANLAATEREVTKDSMHNYVREAVARTDGEWMEYLDRPDVKPSWRKLAGL